jgi:hypothetical protein
METIQHRKQLTKPYIFLLMATPHIVVVVQFAFS